MTDPSADWYQEMAVKFKARDRALAAIEKWEIVLAEAEEAIQALRESDVADNRDVATDVVSDPDKFQEVSFPPEFKSPELKLAAE